MINKQTYTYTQFHEDYAIGLKAKRESESGILKIKKCTKIKWK